MAITFDQELAGNSQKGGANSVSFAGTEVIGAGQLVVVGYAQDNTEETVEGDGEYTQTSCTWGDGGGNSGTLERLVEFANVQGGPANGVKVAIHAGVVPVSVDLGASGFLQVLTGGSPNAAGLAGALFDIAAGAVIVKAGHTFLANDGADPGAITLGSLPSRAYLWVWALAGEGPNTDAYTFDADYTTITGAGTTGGGAASNMHVRMGYRLFTGTTDTVDVTSTTADRDYAQALAALYEVLKEAPPELVMPMPLR